jgi:hypothetical protein
MNKLKIYTAITFLAVGGALTSCDTKKENVEDAKENVADANQELQEAKKELNAEYPAFRLENEARITANEKQIADLKAVVNQPGKLPLDELRKQRIIELKEKNIALRNKLYVYEKENSDWETFKREFNSDMDGLNQAFKDLSKDNKK